jgi:hypothetical protein
MNVSAGSNSQLSGMIFTGSTCPATQALRIAFEKPLPFRAGELLAKPNECEPLQSREIIRNVLMRHVRFSP